MKTLLLKGFLYLTGVIAIYSCNSPEKETFRHIPDNAQAVLTFNPGKLMEKARLSEHSFIKKEMEQDDFLREIIIDPQSSGLNVHSEFGLAFMKEGAHYACLLMPVRKKDVFDGFIRETALKSGIQTPISRLSGYDYFLAENKLIAWNSSLAFILYNMENGHSGAGFEEMAQKMISLEKENSLMVVKDFNQFLKEKQDVNFWISSEVISEISLLSALPLIEDPTGSLSNNYGHVHAAFEKGDFRMKTNLRLNPGLKKTIERYNFIDRNAGKEILAMLPGRDVFMVINTYINPEKLADLMGIIAPFRNSGPGHPGEDFEISEDDFRKYFSGDAGLCITGIKEVTMKDTSDIYGEIDEPSNSPLFHFAGKLSDKEGFTEVLETAVQQGIIQYKEGYYCIDRMGLQRYACIQNDFFIASNVEEYILEICKTGVLHQNLLKTELASSLIEKPVSMYINMDMGAIKNQGWAGQIDDKIRNRLPGNTGEIVKGLKALWFRGDLEEWDIRLDLRNSDENSLYLLLKEMDQ